jgi:hypothetical protein
MRYLGVVAFVLVLFVQNAKADIFYDYAFSGNNGLSGNFSLDATAGFVTTCDIPTPSGCITGSTLISPSSALVGSFGPFIFSGGTNLYIQDVPADYPGFCCRDHWIVRAGQFTGLPLVSNMVNGQTVTGLSLSMFGPIGGRGYMDGPSLIPPEPIPTPVNFQYTIYFSDGTFDNASLDTLELLGTHTVPEPSMVAMFIVSLLLARPLLGRLHKHAG